MRTVNYNLYEFDELNPLAKAYALKCMKYQVLNYVKGTEKNALQLAFERENVASLTFEEVMEKAIRAPWLEFHLNGALYKGCM